MRLYWIVVGLLVWMAGAPTLVGQDRSISKITIKSSWAGLSDSARSTLKFKSRGGRLLLRGRAIHEATVTALIHALEAEPVSAEDGFDGRISQQWLDHHADWAATHIGFDGANEESSFRERFANRTLAMQILLWRQESIYLDNDRTLELTIKFDDGRKWSARAYSPGNYMLPWRVNRNGQDVKTYQPLIAVAIAALMPEGALNRWLLTDETVAEGLARDVSINMLIGKDGVAERIPD